MAQGHAGRERQGLDQTRTFQKGCWHFLDTERGRLGFSTTDCEHQSVCCRRWRKARQVDRLPSGTGPLEEEGWGRKERKGWEKVEEEQERGGVSVKG